MTRPADDHTTSPERKCFHLMHLPSGKCLGCGEQHQPLADYKPGDDEEYTREHLAEAKEEAADQSPADEVERRFVGSTVQGLIEEARAWPGNGGDTLSSGHVGALLNAMADRLMVMSAIKGQQSAVDEVCDYCATATPGTFNSDMCRCYELSAIRNGDEGMREALDAFDIDPEDMKIIGDWLEGERGPAPGGRVKGLWQSVRRGLQAREALLK